MTGWHEVARASEILEGTPYATEVEGAPIAIVRLGNELYAIGDVCPHLDYVALSDGYLEGTTIECPMHQSCFDVRTGAVLGPPALEGVPTYAVRLEADTVLVQV